jgi:hypothetical protein
MRLEALKAMIITNSLSWDIMPHDLIAAFSVA